MDRLNILNEVFNCDCLDFMKIQPDKTFDLAIADPPYGINAPNMRMGEKAGYISTATRSKKSRLNTGEGKLKNRTLNTMSCDWDLMPPTQEFFDELFRVSKNQIIWGGNYFQLPPTRCIVCWDKMQPWDNFSQIELAWTSFDIPAKIFRKSTTGGSVPNMRLFPKIHPTQKPVELYAYLFQTFAKKGNIIFDPMMGSQSSRVAAFKLGFDYMGCEIDNEYYVEGCRYFDRECHGVSTLSDGRAIQQLSIFETIE